MRKLKIPGRWKLVTKDGWMPEGLNHGRFVKYEVSSVCESPRLISPSGSFWEGEEKINMVAAMLKNQKRRGKKL